MNLVNSIKENRLKHSLLPLFLLLSLFFVSCVSKEDNYADALKENYLREDFGATIYYREAQDQYDKGLYEKAIFYYRLGAIRFPDELANVATSLYEIGFIEYKSKNYQLAISYFSQVSQLYEKNPLLYREAPSYPPLMAIVTKEIEKINQKKRKKKSG